MSDLDDLSTDGERPLTGGGRTAVDRRGEVVLRSSGPWSPSVVELLRHLDDVGYLSAPRVIGTGFDELGRETISYVDGWTAHPHAWPDEVLPRIGQALRELHDATATFRPESPRWQQWFGRNLGDGPRVIGHCDAGPWNILAAPDHRSITLIDWETAGPVDPLVEIAQACWLNAQLHDDRVAEMQGLPSANDRARQARLLVDGYGLTRAERAKLFDLMVAVAISDASEQARDITPTTTSHDELWAIAWRTRSAAWILDHRTVITKALS